VAEALDVLEKLVDGKRYHFDPAHQLVLAIGNAETMPSHRHSSTSRGPMRHSTILCIGLLALAMAALATPSLAQTVKGLHAVT